VNLCLSVHPKFLNIWIQLALAETLACSEKLELKLAPVIYPVLRSVVGVDQSVLHASTEQLQLCRMLTWLECVRREVGNLHK